MNIFEKKKLHSQKNRHSTYLPLITYFFQMIIINTYINLKKIIISEIYYSFSF